MSSVAVVIGALRVKAAVSLQCTLGKVYSNICKADKTTQNISFDMINGFHICAYMYKNNLKLLV